MAGATNTGSAGGYIGRRSSLYKEPPPSEEEINARHAILLADTSWLKPSPIAHVCGAKHRRGQYIPSSTATDAAKVASGRAKDGSLAHRLEGEPSGMVGAEASEKYDLIARHLNKLNGDCKADIGVTNLELVEVASYLRAAHERYDGVTLGLDSDGRLYEQMRAELGLYKEQTERDYHSTLQVRTVEIWESQKRK